MRVIVIGDDGDADVGLVFERGEGRERSLSENGDSFDFGFRD